MDTFITTLFIGIVATAVSDVWGIARQPLLGIAPPDYGLVGRWLAHMRHGQFRHDAIVKSPPVRGERVLGWTAHYLIGIAFAAALVGLCGSAWLQQPMLLPALLTGIATVAAPFLLMQPGMGAGIAASRTPRPAMARAQSLITHTVFGLGLYVAAQAARFLQF